MKFCHLHLHTEYSMLDGLCRLEDLFVCADKLDLDTLAITDHHNISGVVKFFQLARKYNIKPIIGVELDVSSIIDSTQNTTFKELIIPLAATNNVHYLLRDDSPAHIALSAIKNISEDTPFAPKNRNEYYLKTDQDIKQLFKDIPEAISNTRRIAERCNVYFDLEQLHYPYFPLPSGYTTESKQLTHQKQVKNIHVMNLENFFIKNLELKWLIFKI